MKYLIGAALGGLIVQGLLAYYYPACRVSASAPPAQTNAQRK